MSRQLDLDAESLLRCIREFRLSDDMFAQDSIELLKSSGIDFAKMEARGIDVSNFGELLMSSGIVLNEDVSKVLLVTCSAVLQCHTAQRHNAC